MRRVVGQAAPLAPVAGRAADNHVAGVVWTAATDGDDMVHRGLCVGGRMERGANGQGLRAVQQVGGGRACLRRRGCATPTVPRSSLNAADSFNVSCPGRVHRVAFPVQKHAAALVRATTSQHASNKQEPFLHPQQMHTFLGRPWPLWSLQCRMIKGLKPQYEHWRVPDSAWGKGTAVTTCYLTEIAAAAHASVPVVCQQPPGPKKPPKHNLPCCWHMSQHSGIPPHHAHRQQRAVTKLTC